MSTKTAPTDQRAGVRPIAFVLQDYWAFGEPVTLNIRPSDLTRTEPSRVTVHQTLGRSLQGWADDFGAGLPSVTIAGHTGWRTSSGSGMDGVEAFEKLNSLITKEFHALKQSAIDTGIDPDTVKLLFVDMLDGFYWIVTPIVFALQRSRSQPLLMKYNIQLQAIATDIDNPLVLLPQGSNVAAGLGALDKAISKLKSFAGKIQEWVGKAVAFKDKLLGPVAAVIKKFTDLSTAIFSAVDTAVSSVKNGVSSFANSLIGIAGSIAQVGVNVFRTISSIASLPGHLKSAIGRVAGAFNEVVCIFKNSLKPQKTYEDYTGLYGASNCSSTTGGRQGSAYSNMNAFDLMQPVKGPVQVSAAAMAAISSLNRGDPVLSPMSIGEIGRNLNIMNDGIIMDSVAATA